LLEHIKEMLKPGGTVVASNVSKKMVEDDPFTCFIMNNLVNWVMNYKDEDELRGIFGAAGYEWKGAFTDELGFHIMGIGVIQ
jgi:predicted secreted protein